MQQRSLSQVVWSGRVRTPLLSTHGPSLCRITHQSDVILGGELNMKIAWKLFN